MSHQPKYPIYVISKGRWGAEGLTARFLIKDRVDFHLVVEPQEADLYAASFGRERLYVLPFSNLGQGSIPARNWVKEHSTAAGHERHWILDDNIRTVYRWYKGERIYCDSKIAFAAVEDFTDRYENIAISGLNYKMFAIGKLPPFFLNHHVYSFILLNNAIPHRWRGRYNEDTDLCLQVLADGWCTVLVNAFLADKMQTMKMKGGNMETLYRADGRLKMARSLERMWPGVVTTGRRYKRPQHKIKDEWRRFDNKLILKPGIDLNALRQENPYDIRLVQTKPTVKNPRLRKMLREYNDKEGKS